MSTNPLAPSEYPPFRIGEITVIGREIRGPGVVMPLAGSEWIINDQRIARTRISPTIIALAVIFGVLLCGLGFLLLLITETVYEGPVQVTAFNGSQTCFTLVTVNVPAQLMEIHNQVRYAQTLSAHFASQA